MKTLLKIFLAVLFINSFQASRAADYQGHAKEVRETVWNWDRPEFNNYEIPEAYKNESAVIIAHRNELYVTNKNKFKLVNILLSNGPGVVNRLYYTEIDRYMVKINDQKALQKYSELSYKEEKKFDQIAFSNKIKTIVGARVIKPGGEIREINIRDEAVSITEGKKEKESYKKIAISDLQEGDILDYFFCTEIEYEGLSIPTLSFYFFDQYPVLSYSISCEISKNLTVEYRSINGAPDMTETRKKDENTLLEASRKDIPKVETVRWMSYFRSMPIIRMNILNNANNSIYKPASARKNGIYKNVPQKDILNDVKGSFAFGNHYYCSLYQDVTNSVKKDIKNYKKQIANVSDEDLASYIYDATYFHFGSNFGFQQLSPNNFFALLHNLLKMNKIEHQMGFVTSKYGARDNEVLYDGDYDYVMIANKGKQVFCFPFAFVSSDYLDFNCQGETAHTITIGKFAPGKKEEITGIEGEYTIPVTNLSQNKSSIVSEVSFSKENPLLLHINRKTSWSGDLKYEVQPYFVVYEDWSNTMRNRLLINKTFIQEIEEKDKKSVEDLKKQMEEKRKNIKEQIAQEIKEYYDKEPTELIDYKVENSGITSDAPELIFQSDYTMDGFVKKAGNNLILQVGKLIGTQWNPVDANRNRTIDAYLHTARSFENEIQINIPQGFEVQNIEKLNQKTETEYGLFESSARIENGRKLIVKTRKDYKKAFVPAKDWNLLLNILDKANEFAELSVVLKAGE